MSKPGRPRKPTPLKILQGTWRQSKDQAPWPARKPRMPTGLPDEQKPIWRHIVRVLHEQQVLHLIDVYALEVVVGLIARYREAREMVAKSSAVLVRTSAAGVKTAYLSPWHKIQVECATQIRLWAGELGLTPAARAALLAQTQKPEDPEDEVIYGRRHKRRSGGSS